MPSLCRRLYDRDITVHIGDPMDIYIGRQPIFDNMQSVMGYELLFRATGDASTAQFMDGDQATMRVILNTFLEFGTANLTGDKLAFINLTENFINGKYPIPLPCAQTAIEVLEKTQPTPETLAALHELSRQGYQVVLDDISYFEQARPLLDAAQIVKVDVQATPPEGLEPLVRQLKSYPVKLIAEKVENQDVYAKCQKLGFDYYQGFYFCRPTVIQQKKMGASSLVVMQTLAKLQDPNVSFADLEELISRDVFLSYKLLMLINSGYYSLKSEIHSVRQAISIIGLKQLRSWMTLIMLSQLHNKPPELSRTALIRAFMAESIARLQHAPTESFYLSGLFSVLDAYLDRPMEEIIEQVPLAAEICEALVSRSGSEGRVLAAIEEFEHGRFEAFEQLGIYPAQLNEVFSGALIYADSFVRLL